MSDIRPPVPAKLEDDLSADKVTIQYKDGGELKETSYSWAPSSEYGGVNIELRPVVVVTNDEADPGGYHFARMVASIPLKDVVSIEVGNYAEGKGPAFDDPIHAASWHRDSEGQLRRFSPE